MKRLLSFVAATSIIAGTLLLVGCSSTAPASPPQATAAPKSAASAPTTAPSAPTSPTAVTAASPAKAGYPDKGKVITMIVPFAAGGSVDTGARLLAPIMEKELGVPIQLVNKPAASTQAGSTDLVASKPDGYTVMMTSMLTTIVTYLDTSRKATYTGKDFQVIATGFKDVSAVAVLQDSPYKSYQDLVDAAKARPGAIKIAVNGRLTTGHLGALQLEQMAGVEFAMVQYDSGANAMNAVLGGHVDAVFVGAGNIVSPIKNGQARAIAILSKSPSPLLPGVKTAEEQGYPGQNRELYYALVGPTGMPKEAVDVLSQTVKKATESPDVKAKMNQVGMDILYADSATATAQWSDGEAWAAPLVKLDKANAQ